MCFFLPSYPIDGVKTAYPNPACRCQYVTFTLTVTNTGPAAAQQIVITDALSPDFGSAVYSLDYGRTWQNWTGSYSVGTLAAGGSASILAAGIVSSRAKGCICNSASVSSLNSNPNPSNNTASVAVRIKNPCCCHRNGGQIGNQT